MDETRRIGRTPPPPGPRVRVATRAEAAGDRSSPWMRFDLLQIVAWAIGLFLVVAGLVALARSGFDNLSLLDPVVEVTGLPATPMLALMLVLIGTAVLTLATGVVDDRSLRVSGVIFGVVGAVWLIEPGAFEPYLGIRAENGSAALFVGFVLTGASFVPPLLVRRPGTTS